MRRISLIPKLARAALFLTLAMPAGAATDAHTPTDATTLGQRIELPNTWLFSPNDNPSNASPTLDDSAWTSISTDKPLTSYGFRYYPYAWYRLHIHIRPDTRAIAVEAFNLNGSFEVFVNGERLGTFGNLSDHFVAGNYNLLSFPIPDRLLAQANGNLLLALRFSVAPATSDGTGTVVPIPSTASIGLAAQSDFASDASFAFSLSYGIVLLIACLSAVVGFVALVLFISIRSQREYLPLSVFLLQPITHLALVALAAWYGAVPFGLDSWVLGLLYGIALMALVEFIRLVLAIPHSRWFLAFEISLLFASIVTPLAFSGYFPIMLGFFCFFVPRLLLLVLLPTLLFRSWKRTRDAQLLLPAVFLASINIYVAFLWWVAYYLHIAHLRPFALAIHFGDYTLTLAQLGDIFFAVGMLFFILLRTIRISRSRATLTAEIDAAATVQSLLLARSSQPTPGFLVDTVFLPASSLGGDFFLLTTHPFDGSLIAVVGDVSGKGLTAAMRVAMILGCLRRETSHHPGDILASLNDAILAQGELGFTTALCVRLFLNGDFILANAGHIPPFITPVPSPSTNTQVLHSFQTPNPDIPPMVAGMESYRPEWDRPKPSTEPTTAREFPTPPALPLGIAPGEVYHLEKGHLAPAERLVLMSDGVPEARSHSGQLYGFDRLQHLALLPAHDIAATAQDFGQEDDITVLTLTLAPTA
jgi:sigma-B regulation protein RsbU (phosphoserine phosphatase)